MPANYPLHLAFSKEQMEWLESESERYRRTKSKIVQDLVEAERKGESHHAMLRELSEKMDQLRAKEQLNFANSFIKIESILAYVKEIFRESSANLYRLNAVIDEFQDPEKVRASVNEFVRKQESEMRFRIHQILQDNS